MMYTHRTWEPEFDLNTEDGLVSELLLLAAQYYSSRSYQQSTGESTPRPLKAKKGYSIEEFLKAALKGDRIAMPIPGAGVLLHTKDFAKAVGDWDNDREMYSGTCIHYSSTVHHPDADRPLCPSLETSHCPYGAHCQEKDLRYENKRFGKDVPRKLSEIVDYVASGKAAEDRTPEPVQTPVGEKKEGDTIVGAGYFDSESYCLPDPEDLRE